MTRKLFRPFLSLTLSAALLATLIAPAAAHITLEQREARIGNFYKAVFRVPHGCDGAATTKLTLKIPAGVISVKPMAKPGWRIDIKRGDYDKPYSYMEGAKFTQGPREITWSGGNLPDAYYDEFVVLTFLAGELTAGTTLYFPVDQICEKGAHHWTAVPVNGKAPDGDPAPGLTLLPKATSQAATGHQAKDEK